MRELIQIDVAKVLASKLGAKAKYVPKGAIRWLERTICQDELNRMLRDFFPLTGAPFCDAALADLNASITATNPEKLPQAADRRVIFVCNHPLGGLDGIALISLLSSKYGQASTEEGGPGVKFVVNDLLMAVEPLSDVFLPINKHGRQSKEAIQQINDVMSGPDPVLIFPAGLVSRRGKGGAIADLQWHKMFVAKAIQYKRDVVPLFFSGENSQSFYKLAQRRKRLGIPFNIEMLYLPQELVRSRGKAFSVTVGDRIPWQDVKQMGDALAAAQRIKQITYSMSPKN